MRRPRGLLSVESGYYAAGSAAPKPAILGPCGTARNSLLVAAYECPRDSPGIVVRRC